MKTELRTPEILKIVSSSTTFVRHGESEANTKDIILYDPLLTEAGRDQARNAGLTLLAQGLNPHTFVHTGLQRTRDTATIIRDTCFPDVKLDRMRDFQERNMGSYNGATTEQVLSEYPDIIPIFEKVGMSCIWFLEDSDKDIERISDMAHRILRGLYKIYEKFSHDQVVIVAHSGSIKMAQLIFSGMQVNNFPHALSAFQIDNGGIITPRSLTRLVLNPLPVA